MTQQICSRCAFPNGPDARFCAGCGARTGGGSCRCGAPVSADGRFCSACGGRVAKEGDRPAMARPGEPRADAGLRWLRSEHELASRIDRADLASESARLEVQAGTRALLFHGGRYVGTLPPGSHPLAGVRDELELEAEPSVILVDDGEIGLEMAVDDLRSADPHRVSLQAELVLRLVDPELFLANLLRDRARFSVADLSAFLDGEIRGALGEAVATLPAADLDGGRARSRLEMELLARWRGTFERCGFVLQRFRLLGVEVPALEAGHRAAAEAADRKQSGEARRVVVESELEGFALDAELLRRRGEGEAARDEVEIDLELRRLQRDLERLEARGPLLERMQEKSLTERMANLRGEEEWRKLRQEVDRDRLLAAREWELLQEESQRHRAEIATRKTQLDEYLRRQARQNLQELEIKQKYRLELLEMRGDTELAAEQTRRARRQVEEELAARGLVFDQELDERRRWSEQEVAERRQAAETQVSEVERLEDLRQRTKDRDAARRLQEHATRVDIDKKRVLEESSVYGEMSPEKIVSMAVARHPERAVELGAALEAARSAGSERRFYERLLTEVKEATGQRMAHEQAVAVGRTGGGGWAASAPAGSWQRCEEHEIKFPVGASCPLCVRPG